MLQGFASFARFSQWAVCWWTWSSKSDFSFAAAKQMTNPRVSPQLRQGALWYETFVISPLMTPSLATNIHCRKVWSCCPSLPFPCYPLQPWKRLQRQAFYPLTSWPRARSFERPGCLRMSTWTNAQSTFQVPFHNVKLCVKLKLSVHHDLQNVLVWV